VLAAGSGRRLDRPEPKAFVEVAGRPMFEWSLLAIGMCSHVSRAVLVVPPSMLEHTETVGSAFPSVASVVAGGPTRQESVERGIVPIPPSASVVVCHDAARPLAAPELFDRVVDAVMRADVDGAVPVVPSSDTVKRIRAGMVEETIPREAIGLAQTPQAFRRGPLEAAHAVAAGKGLQGTDDAMLLEGCGYRVVTTEGDPENFKITTRSDLRRARDILAARMGASAGGLP